MPPINTKDLKANVTTQSNGRNTNYLNILAIALLCCLGIIVYSNTFNSPFHFDDMHSIVDNPAIKNIRDLRSIWNFWPTRFITNLSIAINYQSDGFEVFGYRLFNFFLHLGSVILVWWLTILTFNTPSMKKEAISIHAKQVAFFTSAIFLLHPIQTQPVNYIVQRATLLAAFFYMASFSLYVKARLKREESPDSHIWTVFYAGSLLSAIMSIFSKEMAVSLPLVIYLYEFFFLTNKKSFKWKYPIPFIAIILIVPLTMLVTKSVDFKAMHMVGESPPGISAGHYFLTQLRVIATYIRLLFIPINQNLDYDYPVAKSIFEMPVIFSLLLLLLILFTGIRLFYRHRLASFGIFLFFITLLPESSVIPIADVIFEHRLYLPMAGYSLFLVSGLYYLFKEKRVKFIFIIFFSLIVCYSIAAHHRNKVWENDLTLWDDTVHKSPLKARPHNMRGLAYLNKGNLDQAIYDYNESIKIDPKDARAYINRGNAYLNKGNLDQAISDYDKSIEVNPKYANAYNNRGVAYLNKGNLDQAISDYNKAIEMDPKYAAAYCNRAEVYFRKQEYANSWEDVHRAQALGYKVRPEFIEVLKKARYEYK